MQNTREHEMESAHEPTSWKDWFASNGPGLLLCARQWTRSLADAEDVLQEAFVRYWRGQRNLQGDPRALLLTSMRRAAVDLARKDIRRVNRETNASADPSLCEDLFEADGGIDGERRREIEAAMARLPQEQREVLVLKLWQDLTFERIGEVLGISPNTAASRYRYALAALRKELTPVCHG